MEAAGGLGIAFEQRVDQLMILLQQLETMCQPGIGGGEQREILIVLDLVMPFQVAKEMIEPWREPTGKPLGIHLLFPEISNALDKHPAQFAKHVMPLDPETAEFTDRMPCIPFGARIFLDQDPEIVRQS